MLVHHFLGRLPPAIVPGATQCRPLVKDKDGMNGMLWNLDGHEGFLRNAIHELALLKSMAAKLGDLSTSRGSVTAVTTGTADASEERTAEEQAVVPRVKLAFMGALPENCFRRGLHIVTEEAWDFTLTSFMEKGEHMDAAVLQSFSRQLLAGVGHLHARGVVHRLLCRSCLKLDAHGNLRIAGLHSACAPIAGVRPVCTSTSEYAGHYKAPELMLGIGEFSPACDMWAVGAIFGCMCRYMRIIQDLWPFADQSEIALLFGIFRRLGTPLPPHPLTRLPDYSDEFPIWKAMGWGEVQPCIGSAGAQLLTALTDLDPESRVTASDALCHPFFHKLAGPDLVEEFQDEVIQACCVQGREDWRDTETAVAIEEMELEEHVTNVKPEDRKVAEDGGVDDKQVITVTDPWHKFHCSAAEWCLAQELEVERQDQAHRWIASMCISIALRRRGSRNMLVKTNILGFLYARGGCPSEDLFDKQTDINPAMRAILVDWLFEVCLKYRHDFGTLCMAVSILDEHIAKKPILRSNLQLLGVAAFLVASKVLGDKDDADRIDLGKMSYITASAYTKQQVQEMEEELLPYVGSSLMSWGPYHFLSYFVVMLKLKPRYADLARFCLLQSLMKADLSPLSGSLRAAAACTVALKIADDRKELTGTFAENNSLLGRLSGRDGKFLQKSAERIWTAVHGFKTLKAMKKMYPDAWKLVDPAQASEKECSKGAKIAGA